MKKKKFNKKLIILIFILIVLAVIINYSYLAYNKFSKQEELVIKSSANISLEEALSTKNYITVNVSIVPGKILMKDSRDNCFGIPVEIDDLQAYSIQKGIENKIGFRPMIHDIIKDIFDEYNFKVLIIKITEYKDQTYFANIVIKQENKTLNLDIKPSDAIAMALRTNMPIYLNKELMNKYGGKIC